MKEKNELKEITGDTLVWQIIKEQKPKKYKLSELIAELKKPSADAEIRKNESKSFDTKTPKFDNEEWKLYWSSENKNISRWTDKYKKIKIIEVSNFGRVRFTYIDGKIEIKQQIEYYDLKTGYLCLEGNYNDLPDKFIYQMIANTWLIKDGNQEDTLGEWHVHHILNNGYDNRPENLIWIRKTLHFDKVHTPAREKQ